jgi:membrane dipeptidase
MNDLGVLVDTSHASERTTLDAIELSAVTTAVTHSGCRALRDHDRCKSDEVLAAVGETKGYFGILAIPTFLTGDEKPTLDHLFDHLDHAVGVAGVDCVGIGTDWSAGGYTSDVPQAEIDSDPESDPEHRRRELEGLKAMGFRDEHLTNIFARLEGLQWWRDWPNITRGLVARGYSDDEIRGILGENWLRVFAGAVG